MSVGLTAAARTAIRTSPGARLARRAVDDLQDLGPSGLGDADGAHRLVSLPSPYASRSTSSSVPHPQPAQCRVGLVQAPRGRDRLGQRADGGVGDRHIQVEGDRRHRGELDVERSAPDGDRPRAPRKARTAWALASVGTSSIACSRRVATASVRPREPHQPPAAATSASRASTSSGDSSASQPMPNTPSSVGAPAAATRWAAASMIASHSGLRSPGSPPLATTSPPTSTNTSRSRSSSDRARCSPWAIAAGPSSIVTSTVGRSRKAAIRDSPKYISRPRTRVLGPASSTPGAISSAPSISSTRRGPGTGSNGRRSQLRPPTSGSAPS